VIERCSSTHNYTAVLRTAEALGIQHVFLIQPPVENPDELVKNEAASTIDNGCGQELKYNEEGDLIEVIDKSSSRKSWKRRREVFVTDLEEKKKHAAYARNACKYITLHTYTSTQEGVDALRAFGVTDLWVTDLSQRAEIIDEHILGDPERVKSGFNYDVYPKKLALVLGTESTGVSELMLELADKRVYLPLTGFADSLNLSVATALVLQRIMLLFPPNSVNGVIGDDEKHELRKVWYKTLARNEEDEELYNNALETKLYERIQLLDDLRRCDEHRTGWMNKKVKRKVKARYNLKDDEATWEVGVKTKKNY